MSDMIPTQQEDVENVLQTVLWIILCVVLAGVLGYVYFHENAVIGVLATLGGLVAGYLTRYIGSWLMLFIFMFFAFIRDLLIQS